MPTKTTKKPRARKPRTRAYSEEYTELRTELIRYINDMRAVLSGDMQAVRDGICTVEYAKHHLDKLGAEAFKNLEIRYDRHIDELRLHVGKSFNHVEEKLKLLDDRQGDAANSSRAMYLTLKKHQEQLDMFGCDITNLFAAHGDLPGVEKLIKEQEEAPKAPPRKLISDVLRTAYNLISHVGPCMDPVGALKHIAKGPVLADAVGELYRAVDHIWDLTPGEIRDMNTEQQMQLLNEWNDGMVKDKEDVLLAFNVAIRTADR